MKLILEIRAAEGGADARLLAQTQASVYRHYARRCALTVRERSTAPG
jgi:protein subunit release factor A